MIYEMLSGSLVFPKCDPLGTLTTTLEDRTVQPLFADEWKKASKTLGSWFPVCDMDAEEEKAPSESSESEGFTS